MGDARAIGAMFAATTEDFLLAGKTIAEDEAQQRRLRRSEVD